MNENPQDIAIRAHQSMREGRLDEALSDLGKLKILAPTDPSVYLMMAFAHRAKGNPVEAKAAFQKTVELAPNDIEKRAQYASYLDDLGEYDASVSQYDKVLQFAPNQLNVKIDRTLALAKTSQRIEALNELENLAETNAKNLRAWTNLAILLREDMDYDGVDKAIAHILSVDPQNFKALQLQAQCAYDRGWKSSHLFAAIDENDDDNHDLVAKQAGALLQEGEVEKATSLIEQQIEKDRLWIQGHQMLAEIRWQMGEGEEFSRSFRDAISQNNQSLELWAGYVSSVSRAFGHPEALELIDKAKNHHPDNPIIHNLAANSFSEIGEYEDAEREFAKIDIDSDPSIHLAFLRFLIRSKQFERAIDSGLALVARGAGADAWPYISIAWRITGDPRWEWLEGSPGLVGVYDIDEMRDELPALANRLREIHNFKVHPYGQSLRGGTQTDGELFRRQEPEIVTLVNHLKEIIGQHLNDLPPMDQDHPLLSRNRGHFQFTGSWSVRLVDEGFHVNHIHNQGDISSAFYVALPESMSEESNDQQKNGWLALGQPAVELGTGLEPVRLVKPRPGRLVLFPSTMWHGTMPFSKGERMTSAFDVKLI